MSNNTHIVNDPIIDNQKFVCLSFLMPENIKDNENNNLINTKFKNFRMLKIRGSFSNLDDAKNYAIKLRDDVEPHVNVYVAEVGKWIPFSDDDSLSDDIEYREKQLNDLMKLHKEHIEKSKKYIKEKASLDTNNTVNNFNTSNDNTNTFDKINELKQKLKITDTDDNKNLDYFRNNNM